MLVEADSARVGAIARAEDTAAETRTSVVSNSYGLTEYNAVERLAEL